MSDASKTSHVGKSHLGGHARSYLAGVAHLPAYHGPLGVHFNPAAVNEGADFYLWAPTAKQVVLRLGSVADTPGATPNDPSSALPPLPSLPSGTSMRVPLSRGSNGHWHTRVNTDVWGATYWYELTFAHPTSAYIQATNNGTWPKWAVAQEHGECLITAVDPYARAVTANGEFGVAIDPECLLQPRTWPASEAANRTAGTAVDSTPQSGEVGVVKRNPIIYEAHIRDMTIAPGNGIEHKGQFLGLAQAGARTTKGNVAGLDYIASLGVTHVQLLPVADYGSVDELGDLAYNTQYNWGYDPVHYNAPEGSYSSDPGDPEARIRELRALIDAFHARGLGVIMDVVYNHVWHAQAHSFERTVPGYFFRMAAPGESARACETYQFLNGSSCGNETASERSMMRRYIIDSMTYWARVYGFDGFRMDLMGLHDVVTLNSLRRALDDITTDGEGSAGQQRLLLLGEGWELGNHPPGVLRASQSQGALMPGVAMFNDTFRDAMKGSVFDSSSRGFISGEPGHEQTLYDALLGAPGARGYCDASQSVIYNEAHDNQTVFDKLVGDNVSVPAQRALFALQVQLLAHGTHFIHAGQEFCRTKQGDGNSYRSPDSVNAFDYDRAFEFRDAVDSVRELIAFRRSQPWLNEIAYEKILESHELLYAGQLRIVYRVRGAFAPREHVSGSADDGSCAGGGGADVGTGARGGGADVGTGARGGGADGSSGARGGRREAAAPRHDALVVINGATRPWKMKDLREMLNADPVPPVSVAPTLETSTLVAPMLVARVYDGRTTGGQGLFKDSELPGVPALSVSVFEVHDSHASD